MCPFSARTSWGRATRVPRCTRHGSRPRTRGESSCGLSGMRQSLSHGETGKRTGSVRTYTAVPGCGVPAATAVSKTDRWSHGWLSGPGDTGLTDPFTHLMLAVERSDSISTMLLKIASPSFSVVQSELKLDAAWSIPSPPSASTVPRRSSNGTVCARVASGGASRMTLTMSARSSRSAM